MKIEIIAAKETWNCELEASTSCGARDTDNEAVTRLLGAALGSLGTSLLYQCRLKF